MSTPFNDLKTTAIGNTGEDVVCNYLQARGWNVLARQWRCRWGELDVVACKDNSLRFVEVKTRSAGNWDADGRKAVSRSKQAKIVRTAQRFLQQYPRYADCFCQFDVVLVKRRGDTYAIANYLAGAFDASDG